MKKERTRRNARKKLSCAMALILLVMTIAPQARMIAFAEGTTVEEDARREVEETSEPAESAAFSPSPYPAPLDKFTETPAPTVTPSPTATATHEPVEPTMTPITSPIPAPTPDEKPLVETTASPTVAETPAPTAAPTPDSTKNPTSKPSEKPTATPEPSDEPQETLPPDVTATPVPEDTPAPEETETPAPEETLSPDATETPIPEATQTPDEENDGDGSGLVIVDIRPERKKDWSGVVEYGEGGMPIPQLFQFDYRTIICNYNGIPRSVCSSGCNVTSLSMVIAYLIGDTEQNPQTLFKWAVKNGLYFGEGLGHKQMNRVAAQYGVTGRWIGGNGAAIVDALENGIPVIAHMGPGLFTENGHYIVLRGVTEDGKILVNDPNSKSNSRKAFPLKTILREAKTSEPFMLCTVKSQAKDPISPAVAP